MKVSIIIPAYNEEKRIEKTLLGYSGYFDKLRKNKTLDYEIIVVINGTTDHTESIVKKFSKKNKKILYMNLKKGGKGYAVVEGFKQALKGDSQLIGFVDADMATSPEAFYHLIKEIDNYDAAIASRYVKGAIVKPKPSIQRILVSRIFNLLIRSLFLIPFRDTQCGAKVFKKEAISNIIPNITMSQWAFDVEIIYNLMKKGYTIKEVPTVWSDKKYSTINFLKAGPMMALGIIRLRLVNSPFKFIVVLYNRISNYVKNI